ncbi:MAG: ABC transporter ATP-binding protein/permease [Bacteroidaceae bacterium]|nr:ABC transporter ATP-binding protein/permease [Bacteroidaceae bacterium]
MIAFFKSIKQYLTSYKKYIVGTFILNVLSALFNVFSFALLIPILKILFKVDDQVYKFMEWTTQDGTFNEQIKYIGEAAKNNLFYYSQSLIDEYGQATTLLILGLGLSLLTLLKTGAYFGGSASLMPIKSGIVRDIREKIYRKILSLPLSYFTDERKGDILTRMSTDVNEVNASIGSSLDMIIKNPILILVYIITLFTISWELTLFTFLVVPFLALGIGRIGKKLKNKSLYVQQKWSEGFSQMEETLGGLRIIKAFIAEEKMKDRFIAVNNEYRRADMMVSIRQSAAHPVSEFLGTLMIVIVLWFGGYLIFSQHSSFDASTFIFFLVILYSILQPIKDLSKAGYSIQKGMASLERINKILDAENNIKEIENAVEIDDLHSEIELRNVSFSYNESHKVLQDINLKVKKGQTIALVGQSGSGKSTLVDLIPRYHDIQEGQILIDGTDIKTMSIHSLRSLIGNVNQEAILFNDTVFNNIAFGLEENKDGYTKEELRKRVIEAAKIANAHDFIMGMENGYDTNVGDRGCRLSGGQRQRISIARAILKNPPILILDEATSALDTESERLVQDALERLMKSRTTIAIAHRLSTIKNADCIYVLHEGKIVEQGSHDMLIAQNGYYKRLNDMQQL